MLIDVAFRHHCSVFHQEAFYPVTSLTVLSENLQQQQTDNPSVDALLEEKGAEKTQKQGFYLFFFFALLTTEI